MKLENFAETQGKDGNFVCSSCKFPDSKDQSYCDICHEIFIFLLLESECVCQVRKKSISENIQSDRENTGILKMKFEW